MHSFSTFSSDCPFFSLEEVVFRVCWWQGRYILLYFDLVLLFLLWPVSNLKIWCDDDDERLIDWWMMIKIRRIPTDLYYDYTTSYFWHDLIFIIIFKHFFLFLTIMIIISIIIWGPVMQEIFATLDGVIYNSIWWFLSTKISEAPICFSVNLKYWNWLIYLILIAHLRVVSV